MEGVLTDYRFDSVYFSGEFKTSFNNFNMKEGNYGLRLELNYDADNGEKSVSVIELDSQKDMFGGVYNFSSFFLQEKGVELNKKVYGFTLKFYAKPSFQGVPEYTISNKQEIIPNLFVKNVEVIFGY